MLGKLSTADIAAENNLALPLPDSHKATLKIHFLIYATRIMLAFV